MLAEHLWAGSMVYWTGAVVVLVGYSLAWMHHHPEPSVLEWALTVLVALGWPLLVLWAVVRWLQYRVRWY